MRVIFDTHVLVYWCNEPGRLTRPQQHAVATVTDDNPAIVADISLWEIAVLQSQGRLTFDIPLLQWLNRATAPPLVRIAEITPVIADETARLADWENRDPADRLIVATAKAFGAVLLTNDDRIRSFGKIQTV